MGLGMHLRLMGGRWRPFHSHLELSHANNVFNVINTCHSKLERIITSIIGRVEVMLRVNITDSSTTEACLVTGSSFRKTRIKQSNNIKGFSRNWPLLGGM